MIGIMQGRLLPPRRGRLQSFPVGRWDEEFALAKRAGLDTIEWIYDADSIEQNPLHHERELSTIAKQETRFGIKVLSVCADLFMSHPLLRTSEATLDTRLEALAHLLRQSKMADISWVVLPFVDESRIETDDELTEVAGNLRRALRWLDETGVRLNLETSLDPPRTRRLLAEIDHPLVSINYDSGNSASLGYDVTEEFDAYGDWIRSVHIKDRVLGGRSVPLGHGDVDFDTLVTRLDEAGYRGDFVLQVARGESGDEVAWAHGNRVFLEERLHRIAGATAWN